MEFKDLPKEQQEELQGERTKCEIWSRCMGYHRPVQYWNDGKQSEFRERKLFKEDIAVTSAEMVAL